MAKTDLHPIIKAAARDARLPSWARCKKDRRAHCLRVADLLTGWASELGLSKRDVTRWRATGILHDALKDARPAKLQAELGEEWPAPVVHGPACAARLLAEGVDDFAMLDAIAYHPVGHPELDDLGRFLIMADYLEPGRRFSKERERLKDRLPKEATSVLAVILARRMEKLIKKQRPLMACSVDLWNEVVPG